MPPPLARVAVASARLRRAAREREEHVVERRAADDEVGHAHPRVVEPADGLDDRAVLARDGQRDASRPSATGSLRHPGQGADRRVAVLRRREPDLEALAAHALLELVGRAARRSRGRGR